MRNLEGLIPPCCWNLQAKSKLKNNVELTEFNKNCYDCGGYNPRCPTYHPKESNHSDMLLYKKG